MSDYPGELGRREKGYVPLIFPNRTQHNLFCFLTGAGHRWYHGGQGAILSNGKIYCTIDEHNHEALSCAIRCGARVPPDAWLAPTNPDSQAEAAQAEFERICRIRCAAGWELTELGAWLTHDHDASGDRITAEAWELDGYPKPEDPDYGEWHRAAYTYEARDNDQDEPEPYPLG